jgi:hypothetical protein
MFILSIIIRKNEHGKPSHCSKFIKIRLYFLILFFRRHGGLRMKSGEISHYRRGWAPRSHERRVLLALWWLRLAHALSLSVINDDTEKAWAFRSSERHDILVMEEAGQ